MFQIGASLVMVVALNAGGVIKADPSPRIDGSYIVRFQKGVTPASGADAFVSRYGGKVRGLLLAKGLPGAVIDALDPAAADKASFDSALVSFIEENCLGQTASTQAVANNWALDRIDQRPSVLDGKFRHPFGGGSALVAILDTGLAEGPEFAGRVFDRWWDTNRWPSANDDEGHGTGMASLALGTNLGVAKEARLIVMKVGDAGGVDWGSVARALDYIEMHYAPPLVVNLSISNTAAAARRDVDDRVKRLAGLGYFVSVAAGNNSRNVANDSLGFGVSPARVTEAFTVGATARGDALYSFTNFGALDLYAPGDGVTALSLNGPLDQSGSSASAAFTSGVAALVLDMDPSLLGQAIASRILQAATPSAVNDPRSSTSALLFSDVGTRLDATVQIPPQLVNCGFGFNPWMSTSITVRALGTVGAGDILVAYKESFCALAVPLGSARTDLVVERRSANNQQLVWQRRFVSAGGSSAAFNDFSTIVVDGSDIYLGATSIEPVMFGGISYFPPSIDGYVARLNATTGGLVWATRVGTYSMDAITALTIAKPLDGRGPANRTTPIARRLIAGGFTDGTLGSVGNGRDSFVAALDLVSGAIEKIYQFGGVGSDAVLALNVGVEPNGSSPGFDRVWAAGYANAGLLSQTPFASQDGYVTGFLFLLQDSGLRIQASNPGYISTTTADSVSSIVVDYSGATFRAHVAGTTFGVLESDYSNAGGQQSAFVASLVDLATTPRVEWARQFGTTSSSVALSSTPDDLLLVGGSGIAKISRSNNGVSWRYAPSSERTTAVFIAGSTAGQLWASGSAGSSGVLESFRVW